MPQSFHQIVQERTHLNCHLNSNWNKCAPTHLPISKSFQTLNGSLADLYQYSCTLFQGSFFNVKRVIFIKKYFTPQIFETIFQRLLVLSYESYLLVMNVETRPKSDLYFMFYMHFEGHSNLGQEPMIAHNWDPSLICQINLSVLSCPVQGRRSWG